LVLWSGVGSVPTNEEAADRYYPRVGGESDGDGLRLALGGLLSETHDPPRPMARLSVDLHPDRQLRSI